MSIELIGGLEQAFHAPDPADPYNDGSAYVGSESVAQDFANPIQGNYEDGYIEFTMRPEFQPEFAPYFKGDYQGDKSGTRWEYRIPYDEIPRFNQLTVGRRWIWWQ